MQTLNKRFLCHHGIPGQRWGKRNGPPYPLAKLPARGRKTLDKVHKKKYNKDKAIERGKYFVGSILGKIGGKPVSEFERETFRGFKMLPEPESISKVLQNTNPTKSNNNCFNCVVAAAARLCGLDVTARGDRLDGTGVSFDDVCKVFKLDPDDPNDVMRVLAPSMDKAERQIIRRYSEGDVGAIGFAWNENYRKSTGSDIAGHTINWIIKDGKPLLIDAQIGADSDILVPTISKGMDSNRELSIAKFANVNENLNINNDEIWNFVR